MNQTTTQAQQPVYAISYARYSTMGQALGNSERRQIARAEAHAAAMGWTLLPSIVDEGVSAFRGKNAQAGAGLGDFLRDAMEGRVPHGTHLMIEDFSRLSRQPVGDSILLLFQILQATGPDRKPLNLAVVTLRDGMVYTWETVRSDTWRMIVGIVNMGASHEESLRHSDRQKASVLARRAAGTYPHGKFPEKSKAAKEAWWAQTRREIAKYRRGLDETILEMERAHPYCNWEEWARELNRRGVWPTNLPWTGAWTGSYLRAYCKRRSRLCHLLDAPKRYRTIEKLQRAQEAKKKRLARERLERAMKDPTGRWDAGNQGGASESASASDTE